MTIDNTAMDVMVSTVTTIVHEPTISTITATIKDNIIQIPFDVISQVKDFYEVCWDKLILFIKCIGAISVLMLGYIGYFIPKRQDKKFKELLSEQKRFFDMQIDKQKEEFDKQMNKQKEEFENQIKMVKEYSYKTSSGLYRNSAVIISSINPDVSVIFKLWCSTVKEFFKIGDSIYTKEYMKEIEIMLQSINDILKEDNKNFIDKNRLKEIVNILKNIDKTRISADLEDNINNITEFYNSFNNANKKQ